MHRSSASRNAGSCKVRIYGSIGSQSLFDEAEPPFSIRVLKLMTCSTRQLWLAGQLPGSRGAIWGVLVVVWQDACFDCLPTRHPIPVLRRRLVDFLSVTQRVLPVPNVFWELEDSQFTFWAYHGVYFAFSFVYVCLV